MITNCQKNFQISVLVYSTLNILSAFPLDETIWIMDQSSPQILHLGILFKRRFSMSVGERLLDFKVLDVECIV